MRTYSLPSFRIIQLLTLLAAGLVAVPAGTSYATPAPAIADAVGPVAIAGHDHSSRSQGPSAPEEADRGLVYRGLTPARADGPCRGRGYELPEAGGHTACTHGPDPAPDGIDVTEPRTTASVRAAAASVRSRQIVRTAAADVGSGVAGATGAETATCVGDGVSGNRVQAIYAHPSDVANRYASLVSSIRTFAAVIDAELGDSAAKFGANRAVRWVHDASCNVTVLNVTLPTTGDDDIYATRDALRVARFTGTDRKYLVWMDSTVYCGIAFVEYDDTSASTNRNNGGVPGMVARTDAGCWGLVESHELMHTLGAVQASAPHATEYLHCTDESDRMCYADGTKKPMTYPCPSDQNRLFDCGGDDYFNPNPPAGSYLATHWNTASSSFLDASGVAPPPPPPTTHVLTLTKTGAGVGTVTSLPAGISCGTDCAESFAEGTIVTLTALPAAGSLFSGWSGPCTGTGTCVTTLSMARTVTATFGTSGPIGLAVSVSETGFAPKIVNVAQGTRVTWTFNGPATQGVRMLPLLDTGLRGVGTTYGFTFVAAGIYDYVNPGNVAQTGSVRVPMKITPAAGGTTTTFTPVWATAPAPVPWVYDVQIKRPNGIWTGWQSGVTYASASYVPDAGPGTYRFRARSRKTITGETVLWSNTLTFTAS